MRAVEEKNPMPAPAARRRRSRLAVAVALTCVLLSVAGTGTALAWLSAQNHVQNAFARGTADPTILEDFPEGATVKQNVRVANDGADNVGVYVRAIVSIAWQGADSTTLFEAPQKWSDYSLSWGNGAWVQGPDAIYYYTVPLAPSEETTNLIDSCTQYGTPDDGRHLVVDIAVQAIQEEPAEAVADAWAVSVGADGTIAVPGATS